jgi:hypothetical protein
LAISQRWLRLAQQLREPQARVLVRQERALQALAWQVPRQAPPLRSGQPYFG